MVIPYFHIYGLTVGMMLGIWQGARQILIPKYDVEMVLAALRDYQPTYFPAVPTIFVSLLNHPRLREFNLDRVCTFNSGSAPIAMEVVEKFERMVNVPLNQGYGLSEASPVTHSTPHMAKRKPASIGLPMPDTDMKIVDLDTGTRELPLGEEGELCVAGPQVMKGYWKRPDETALTLRTDEHGVGLAAHRRHRPHRRRRLHLHRAAQEGHDDRGRLQRVSVRRRGRVACASGGDGMRGDRRAATRITARSSRRASSSSPSQTATADELKAHCKTRLTEYKRPRIIDIRESLPKTAVGKILYTKLRAEAAAPHV